MPDGLCATLLCNAGLRLNCGEETLLIDVLNGPCRHYAVVPDEGLAQLMAGEEPYQHVTGILYTHLHPDHFDRGKNEAYRQRNPSALWWMPDDDTPERGRFSTGAFQVDFCRMPHIDFGMPACGQYAFLIRAAGVEVYVAADAAPEAEVHRAFLGGRAADYGFWNPVFLALPEGRRLLREAAKTSFIYHMPVKCPETHGIHWKAERCLGRYSAELPNVTVLTEYPTELVLPQRK